MKTKKAALKQTSTQAFDRLPAKQKEQAKDFACKGSNANAARMDGLEEKGKTL